MGRGLGRCNAIAVSIMRVRACGSVGCRCRLEHWRLRGIVVILGNPSCSRSMRSIRLCRRQMRMMHIHVRLCLIHAADGACVGIITVGDRLRGQGIFRGSRRIQGEPSLAAGNKVRSGRRTPALVYRRGNTGQAQPTTAGSRRRGWT